MFRMVIIKFTNTTYINKIYKHDKRMDSFIRNTLYPYVGINSATRSSPSEAALQRCSYKKLF